MDQAEEQKFVSALRALIREEGLPKSAATPPVTGKQRVAALLAVSNSILVVLIIPAVFSSEQFKLLFDLLPWILSVVAASLYTQFNARLKQMAGQTGFLPAMVVLQVVLILGLLPLFRIDPELWPKNAQLCVDGQNKRAPFSLRLGSYAITILKPRTKCSDETSDDRGVALEWWSLLGHFHHQPVWALNSQLEVGCVSCGRPPAVLKIERQGDFDEAFLAQFGADLRSQSDPDLSRETGSPRVLRYNAARQLNGHPIVLPVGPYSVGFLIPGQNCQKWKTSPVLLDWDKPATFTEDAMCLQP